MLILDELAEFKPSVIDSIRQPMEDKKVLISRVQGSIQYPADFVLCAATNPCKCGFYPDRAKCSCTEIQVKNYLGKISKPILDRIDICIETALPRYNDLRGVNPNKSSEQIRKEVERVREIQYKRLGSEGINFNSDMNSSMIDEYCRLSKEDEKFLEHFYDAKGISARGLNKILKVARTIADYENCENIEHKHLCEAITYRNLEEKYWGGEKIEPKFAVRKI